MLGKYHANQTSMCLDPHQLIPSTCFSRPVIFLRTVPRQRFPLVDPFISIVLRVFLCHTLQPGCHLLGKGSLVYYVFVCAFVTFTYGVLGQVWYLIVSISDLYFLPYFRLDGRSPFDLCVIFTIISAVHKVCTEVSFNFIGSAGKMKTKLL